MNHRIGVWMIFLGIVLLMSLLASGCAGVTTPVEPFLIRIKKKSTILKKHWH